MFTHPPTLRRRLAGMILNSGIPFSRKLGRLVMDRAARERHDEVVANLLHDVLDKQTLILNLARTYPRVLGFWLENDQTFKVPGGVLCVGDALALMIELSGHDTLVPHYFTQFVHDQRSFSHSMVFFAQLPFRMRQWGFTERDIGQEGTDIQFFTRFMDELTTTLLNSDYVTATGHTYDSLRAALESFFNRESK